LSSYVVMIAVVAAATPRRRASAIATRWIAS
jgi:hypothetical protein